MKAWLLNQWDRLLNSLWLFPAIGMVAATAFAAVLLRIDDALHAENIPPHWPVTTAPAARATLTTLASGLMTIAGVVFSITMLTLAQTSSLFGSRLLRSFLNHNITQFTLAVFLGTSLYCFVVLWTIRDVNGEEKFVPHLSISVGLALGLVSLGTFVYFIHHVSRSIQAQTVVRNVATELTDAIDRIFPKEGEPPDGESARNIESVDDAEHGLTVAVESRVNGYIQAVDENTLLEIAAGHNVLIRVKKRPGHFVAAGTPIAVVCEREDTADLAPAINECFLTGSRRTPRQDVECAIQELVEVAVRALSPGINDPHTAVTCVDYLGAALSRIVERRPPSPFLFDQDGVVRVIVDRADFVGALNTAFDEVRQSGRGNASVTIRLAETLLAIARKADEQADCEALMRQVEMLSRGCDEAIPERYDRADVHARLREVRELLGAGDSPKAATEQTRASTTAADERTRPA